MTESATNGNVTVQADGTIGTTVTFVGSDVILGEACDTITLRFMWKRDVRRLRDALDAYLLMVERNGP